MKFANIDNQRCEAQPARSGTCPSCSGTVIAKCGDHRVWHWAHKGVRVCDRWWEPETEWHRNWKNKFPADCQEIVQAAQNGEKHVADVKTTSGMVIEFQHSFLKAAERMARESFYRKMVWVVDGRRRKRDAAHLLACIGRGVAVHRLFIIHPMSYEEGALLRDWNSSRMPVYFDLGAGEEEEKPVLWRRDPIRRNYLTSVSRDLFLMAHRKWPDAEEKFSERLRTFVENRQRVAQQSQPLPGFEQYLAYRRRFMRRF